MSACNRPAPGPLYWDFRCLNCDEPISTHASWWKRMLRRLRSTRFASPPEDGGS